MNRYSKFGKYADDAKRISNMLNLPGMPKRKTKIFDTLDDAKKFLQAKGYKYFTSKNVAYKDPNRIGQEGSGIKIKETKDNKYSISSFFESLDERYSLPEVDTAINHFRNDLGYNPDVDEVIDYMVRIGDIEEPEDPEKSMKWYSDWSSEISPRLNEDTVKNKDGTWSNKGKEGTHGKFKTKKGADKQRKAMFANGYKESYSLIEDIDAANAIGDLHPGDKFINRNGVVITIVEPTNTGWIQYRIRDEIRSGSLDSIQNMLYANHYTRMEESLDLDKELKESFNKIDKYCIDTNKKFLDLRSLYESVEPKLTPQNKFELKQFLTNQSLTGDDVVNKVNSLVSKKESLKEDTDDFYDSDEDEWEDVTGSYEVVEHKMVPDSDGFQTDYTLYRDIDTGEYVCVFGDSDFYRPEDGDWDAGPFETEEEALEWFDNYTGFDDDWMDESLILPNGNVFTKPITYKNYKIKQNRSTDEFLSVVDEFGEVESDGFTSIDDAKKYIDDLIDSQMYDDWQMGNVGKFAKYPTDLDMEDLPFESLNRFKLKESSKNKKPRYWNTIFATKVIDAYKNGSLNKDNIDEWEIKYNGGVRPNKSLGTLEILNYYLSTKKDPRNESLKESLDSVKSDVASIEMFLKGKNFINYDIVDYEDYPMETSKIDFEIEGDWKHDHLRFKYLIDEWAKDNGRDIFKIDEQEVGSSDSDYFTALYSVYITKDRDSLDTLNSMRGLFSESLDEDYLTESPMMAQSKKKPSAKRKLQAAEDMLASVIGFIKKSGAVDTIYQYLKVNLENDIENSSAYDTGDERILKVYADALKVFYDYCVETDKLSRKAPVAKYLNSKLMQLFKIFRYKVFRANSQPDDGSGEVANESLVESVKSFTATDIVRDLYDKYPEVVFIDERDIDDDKVALFFRFKGDVSGLEDLIKSYNVDYKIRDGQLRIIAKEDEFNESLTEDVSYSSDAERILDKLTNGFTKDSGSVTTSYEDEKDAARDVLRTYYKYVEVSDGRMSKGEPMCWVVAYSTPRFNKIISVDGKQNNESLTEEHDLNEDYLDDNVISSGQVEVKTPFTMDEFDEDDGWFEFEVYPGTYEYRVIDFNGWKPRQLKIDDVWVDISNRCKELEDILNG